MRASRLALIAGLAVVSLSPAAAEPDDAARFCLRSSEGDGRQVCFAAPRPTPLTPAEQDALQAQLRAELERHAEEARRQPSR
jgi:hypothetical protein